MSKIEFARSLSNIELPTENSNVRPRWNALINETLQDVSAKIIAAQQVQANFNQSHGTSFSFLHAICLISDQLDLNKAVTTRELIEHSNDTEKSILHQSYLGIRTVENFREISDTDLKIATLLFGIEKVHQYVMNEAQLVNQSVVSELEKVIHQKTELLNKLVGFRMRFSDEAIAQLPTAQQEMIGQMDVQIATTRSELELHQQELQAQREQQAA